MSEHQRPFYGKIINRRQEQEYIKKILKKYNKEPVNDSLKQKIWDELMSEKHLGNLTIPFKIALRKDKMGKFPDVIEIILDTKV